MFNILTILLGLLVTPAHAQNTTCANKPASDNSNACANTRYVTTAITNAYPNTWLKSVVGTSQNATATAWSASNQAMWLVGTLTGTGPAPYSVISVNDTANASTAVPATSALYLAHNINSGAAAGSRFSLAPVLTKNTAIAGTDTTKKFYTPLFPQFYIKAGDGGSGPSTFYGDHYGFGSLVQAESGATYLDSVQGGEIDVSVQSGASTALKSILLLASVNSDAVKGSQFDGMLAFGADSTTTAKWSYGAAFGWPRGPWPFDSTSILIGSVAPGSGSRVADWFIDGTNITYTSGFIRSSGFSVGPSGATAVASLASTGAVSGTTGTFTGALGASTISSTGAVAGLVAGPRSGSGNSYQWYNPSGTGIKLTDGGTDLVTIDSAGAISTASNVTGLHHYSTISVPTTSTCGTSPSVDAGSSNHAGKVTFGSATTACTLTFASAYANNAYCTVTPAAQPAAVANIPYISAQSKTAFTISGGTASASYYYTCGGN